MNKIEVRCPNCQTNFLIGNSGNTVTELSDGIHYLVPETIRNENTTKDTSVSSRMKALKKAGINVDKLQTLIQNNGNLKDIFNENDPVLEELSKGGFIHNHELFRRFITAQTFRLINNPKGWTYAVRSRYNTRYVYEQTKRELELLVKLEAKGLQDKDRRFQFFTFSDMKRIFSELASYSVRNTYRRDIEDASSYKALLRAIDRSSFQFSYKQNYIPSRWLNCFKGAGAYYTLQNIIRTHGMILPNCKDMDESLERVENIFRDIIGYIPCERRWDILLSVLTTAVKQTNFELKY